MEELVSLSRCGTAIWRTIFRIGQRKDLGDEMADCTLGFDLPGQPNRC